MLERRGDAEHADYAPQLIETITADQQAFKDAMPSLCSLNHCRAPLTEDSWALWNRGPRFLLQRPSASRCRTLAYPPPENTESKRLPHNFSASFRVSPEGRGIHETLLSSLPLSGKNLFGTDDMIHPGRPFVSDPNRFQCKPA